MNLRPLAPLFFLALLAGCSQQPPCAAAATSAVTDRTRRRQRADPRRHGEDLAGARVEGLGDLSHAWCSPRDQRYAYVFGRDGGLTKARPAGPAHRQAPDPGRQQQVGGAISQDGRLVAVSTTSRAGSRCSTAAPLELVAEIPATRLPGQDRNSRVVGLVDAPGQRFVFSLFDSGEIWIARLQPGRHAAPDPLPRYRQATPTTPSSAPTGVLHGRAVRRGTAWPARPLAPERGVRRVLSGDYGRGQRKLPVYKMPHLEGWTIASDQAFVPAVGHHQVLVLDARDWKQTDAIDVAGQPVFVMTRPDDRADLESTSPTR